MSQTENHLDNANRQRSKSTFPGDLVVQRPWTGRELEVSAVEQTVTSLELGYVLLQRAQFPSDLIQSIANNVETLRTSTKD